MDEGIRSCGTQPLADFARQRNIEFVQSHLWLRCPSGRRRGWCRCTARCGSILPLPSEFQDASGNCATVQAASSRRWGCCTTRCGSKGISTTASRAGRSKQRSQFSSNDIREAYV